jgi:3-phenylpropionate/cinnamic acid dioxygenase small subunit
MAHRPEVLHSMEDSRQIENLIYRYAQHIDDGKLKEVAELFRNAEIVSSAQDVRFVGYTEILSMYENSCRIYDPQGTPLTKHLTTNVIIEVDQNGVEANASSYYTVIQATDALSLQPIISGRYKYEFRKVDTHWQFARREMIVDLIGDCSSHLLYDTSHLS